MMNDDVMMIRHRLHSLAKRSFAVKVSYQIRMLYHFLVTSIDSNEQQGENSLI